MALKEPPGEKPPTADRVTKRARELTFVVRGLMLVLLSMAVFVYLFVFGTGDPMVEALSDERAALVTGFLAVAVGLASVYVGLSVLLANTQAIEEMQARRGGAATRADAGPDR